MKNPWVIIGVITVVLFGGAIWYSSISAERNNEGVEVVSHVKGNPEAEITLVEYSDFQCPACKSFQPVVAEVMEQYGEEIRFEYKHFPLPMHQNAMGAAMAAEAAGQQGQFYPYHDLLFENQQEWATAPTANTFFIGYAEELGLDVPTFRRHLNSSLLRDKVRADLAEARERGVSATPTFFLNGERMDPDEFQTYQGFVEQIAFTVDPEAATSTSGATAPRNGAGSEVRFGL